MRWKRANEERKEENNGRERRKEGGTAGVRGNMEECQEGRIK